MIKLERSKDGQFYFTVFSKNNQKLVTSETYKRKASAVKGIAAVAKALNSAGDLLTYWDSTEKKRVKKDLVINPKLQAR